jgi:acyl carrier protein
MITGKPDAQEVLAWLGTEGILMLPDECGEEEDLFAAGLDSMAVMQLMVAAEVRFGAVFAPGDLTRRHLGTPSSLAALIRTRMVAKPDDPC